MDALIELDEITKDYGRFRALDRVSLVIEDGVTGLLGPNGAGKSTLIKVLLGLVKTTSGSGRFLGYELGRQARAIRANVGYMPEDDCYFHGLTGVESVQVSAQLSNFPALEALRRAHEILDFCGIEQERYRTVETYSTGMRQKLRFAQAIVHDPRMLILDEPTSGLDPEERVTMLNRIRLLARDHGKAVLICTHILPDVQAVSDSVVILVRGSVQVAERLDVLSRPAEPGVHVRLLGDEDNFCRALTAHGLKVEPAQQGALKISGPQEQVEDVVWNAARQSGVGLKSLTPSRNSLEEIFLNAVREQPVGSS
jgi:ABC-2 type transport system ATP-binding protein